MFRSRIKWIALLVLVLSVGSLLVHLSITKSSSVQLASYARGTLWQDFDSLLGAQVSIKGIKFGFSFGECCFKCCVHCCCCRILEISTYGGLSDRWSPCSLMPIQETVILVLLARVACLFVCLFVICVLFCIVYCFL